MNNSRITALEQQLAAIQAEIEKLKAEEEHKKVKPWRADEESRYYAIDADGEILELGEHFGEDCNEMFSCGNYYRTRELAEQDAKELALRGRVRQLRDALCEGYQFVYGKYNYVVFYCHDDEEFQVGCCTDCQDIAEIYFDTEEHAQQACDILNAERGKEKSHDKD